LDSQRVACFPPSIPGLPELESLSLEVLLPAGNGALADKFPPFFPLGKDFQVAGVRFLREQNGSLVNATLFTWFTISYYPSKNRRG